MAFRKRWLIIHMKRHLCASLFIFIIVLIFTIIVYKWNYWSYDYSVLQINTNQLTNELLYLSTEKAESFGNENIENLRKYSESVQRIKQEGYENNIGHRININTPSEHRKPHLRWFSNKVKNHYMVSQVGNNRITKPNYDIHIFYYIWYGNLTVDGKWLHWNHKYLSNWKKEDKGIYPTGTHHPPDDISSNFYPALGCYSSRDPAVIEIHMKQLREANIGVVVVSWYPPGMYDTEGGSSDLLMPLLLDIAHKYDLKVAPHIEPYQNRNPINLLEYIQYLVNHYGSHPAFYHRQHKGKRLPVYYIYDSYLTPSGTWKELLSIKGNLSVRGTKFDGIFIGLLVNVQHRYEIKRAHFDGFYTYFATSGFTYGSSWKNWRSLGKFAVQNNLLFVPSVGPGYIDTQIRPWNVANIRHRRHGKYYEVAWRSAMTAKVNIISITSFNEWHEGTQIEPAIPKSIPYFTYFNYEPEGPDFYLNMTRWWVNEFTARSIGILGHK